MSEQRVPSVFLERRSYRQRRMMDALRLLPFLGILLWMLPLFWPLEPDGETVRTSVAMIYVFSIWIGLIAVSLALVAVLRRRLEADVPAEEQTAVD